ncbi:MAG: argininosuccinate lyase [Acidimicrobiia bacterium]|nr:argininosuccinate lyase [Acidimicrobiia bacterium]
MTLWSGGRFSEGPADELWAFTVDHVDRRMLVDDVRGSIAHAAMLGSVGLLSVEETSTMARGLEVIAAEAADDSFVFVDSDEDVHSAVERRLGEIIGDLAGKLHTGRSRNDQVALDLRLYLKRSVRERVTEINDFIDVLIDQAEAVGDTVVPSYTHVQQAQAVPLAHHLLAYAWMLVRDAQRFGDALGRIDVSPLGAGASGGSSLPLDPAFSANELGLAHVFTNSMDAVASRDFAAEFVWCCTQAMVHLSRLAEEMILWCSSEFAWVTFSDAFTTGSSAMPQKKNADIAELVRGKSAAVIGDLTAIGALQKGLPMTYNRDLQEDKRLVFHANDTLSGSLRALGGMLATASFHAPAPDAWVFALDLAELLVSRGVPFREAHHIVGGLVSDLVAAGKTFADLTAENLVAVNPLFVADDLTLLNPQASVANRLTPGGGSMASVQAQIAQLRSLSTRRGSQARTPP